MGTQESTGPLRDWHGLYRAALFESDPRELPRCIKEARTALVLRSRELFATSPNNDGETEAIENALYALQALENCLILRTKDRRHAPRAVLNSLE